MARAGSTGSPTCSLATDAPATSSTRRSPSRSPASTCTAARSASLHRRPLPSVAEVLAGARTVVVLEDVVDHTNVGAIFRSAAALGVDGVLLSPRCADPLYRRSVKVAMGAVFTRPLRPHRRLVRRGACALRGRVHHGGAGPGRATPSTVEEAVAGQDKVALLMGTEGHGLSQRWVDSADVRAVIPMAGGIDSLNVAAATAVACYVARGRQRG